MNSQNAPDWDKLFDDLEHAIIITKDKKVKPELVQALDRVADEIKSGETMDTQKQLPRLLKSFQELFHNDLWSLRQLVAFSLIYIFYQYREEIPKYLEKGSDVEILSGLLANVTYQKREVRDAVSQSLGGLAAVLGDGIFARVDGLIQHVLQDVVKVNTTKATCEALEGLMTTIGYITGKSPSVSLENWTTMVNILLKYYNDTSVDTYSNHVRLYSVKGLYRIMVFSRYTLEFLRRPELADTFAQIENVAVDRLQETAEINVRRAAASLYVALYEARIKVLDDAAAKKSVAVRAVKKLVSLADAAGTWQARHGICEAIHRLSTSRLICSLLDVDLVGEIFEVLKRNIEKVEKDAPAYGANAVAGKALSTLFVTLYRINSPANTDFTNMFTYYVRPELLFMLRSGQALLVDCTSQAIILLVDVASAIVKPNLADILHSLYKYKFHFSLAVNTTAGVAIRKSYQLLGYASYEEMLTAQASGIIAALSAEQKHDNQEVRFAIFKAFGDFFEKTNSTEDAATNKQVFALLKAAATDAKSSDDTRAAATRAIGSYMLHLAKHSYIDAAVIDAQINEVVSLLKYRLLVDEEASVVKASIRLLSALVDAWWSKLEPHRMHIGAMVFAISKMQDDELKYAGLPVVISLIGNVASAVQKNAGLPSLLEGFTGALSLDEELTDDEERREAVSACLRDISAVDLSSSKLSVKESEKIVSIVAKGLLGESNRESDAKIIQANTLLFLNTMVQNASFKYAISQSSMAKKLSGHLARYLLHLLSNNPADKFEYEAEDEEGESDDEDDEGSDAEDDEEDLEMYSKFKKTPVYSVGVAGRVHVLVDTLVSLISSFDATKQAAFIRPLANLVAAYSKLKGFGGVAPGFALTVINSALGSNETVQKLATDLNLVGTSSTAVSALLVADDPNANLLAAIAYSKDAVPSEVAGKLYEYCIEKGEDVEDEQVKSLLVIVAGKAGVASKQEDMLKELAQLYVLGEEEVDVESDDHIFAAQDQQYGYVFGLNLKEASPYALHGAAVRAVLEAAGKQELLVSMVQGAVESLIEDKEEDEEEVYASKLSLVFYALIAASAAIKEDEDVVEQVTKLVEQVLLPAVSIQQKKGSADDSQKYLWSWRVIEASSKVISSETAASLANKLVTLLCDDSWRTALSLKGQIASFSAAGHLLAASSYIPSAEFLQLFSEMIANEDLDQDKYFVVYVLSALRSLFLQKVNKPMLLPEPRDLSVKDNSTFSAKQ